MRDCNSSIARHLVAIATAACIVSGCYGDNAPTVGPLDADTGEVPFPGVAIDGAMDDVVGGPIDGTIANTIDGGGAIDGASDATELDGATAGTVDSTPDDAPIGLTYTSNPAVYTKGRPIADNRPSLDGQLSATYTVSPMLPAGLTLDPSTGIIAGVPTVITTPAIYTVTAGSVAVGVSITVNDEAPSQLSYSSNPATYAMGFAITPNLPTALGGDVVSYSVSPALPASLVLDPDTGRISGTPTALTATADYSVQATNSGGSTTTTLSITVVDGAPGGLTYPNNPAVYTKGSRIADNSPILGAGEPADSYLVSPSLPAGLVLDPGSGTISGTPVAAAATAIYRVTASNSAGSTTADLAITVNDVAPGGLSYSANPAVYTKGSAIGSNTPTNSGGVALSYAVAPALPAGLTLNPSTGIIAGAPTAITATTTYVVTATNSGGNTTAELSITVNDAPPRGLTYRTNPAVYFKDSQFTDNVPRLSGGGPVVSYSVSPDLPPGMVLNLSTGVIAGTPTAALAKATYVVSATNSGGKTTVALAITVKDTAPDGLSYALNPAVYTKGSAIEANIPAFGGGAVLSYVVSPALPAGLALDASTGIISGTPTDITPPTEYMVTAINSGGSATADLIITVNDKAPEGLVYSANPAVYARNSPITNNVPSLAGGGAVLAYSVSPALPAGLVLSADTGIISGTPTAITPTETYSVVASNSGGSTMVGVSITVNDVAPGGLTYTTNPAVYTKGAAITANVPTSSGGTALAYEVSPALPAGLALNPSTGIISGTPTAIAATATYVVTARNSGGSVSTNLSLTVDDASPRGLSYSTNPAVYIKDSQFTNNVPSLSGGGLVTAYRVSPDLPPGIDLNPATGIISGTPTAATATATYVITASNSGGSTTVEVVMTVHDVAPGGLSYSLNPAVYTKGSAIAANVPGFSGGPVLSFVVDPALPVGLALNPGTGIITGTPTALTATAEYVVTATNSGGTATVGVSITINDIAPSGLTYATNPAVYIKGTTIAENAPTTTLGGGPVVSYGVSPALPAGLTLNASTGVIFGTPTSIVPTASYSITASNSGGSTMATVSISVTDVAPSGLTYSADPVVYTKGVPIANNTPSLAGGGPALSYGVSPPLPAGLVLDASSGVLSGTPADLLDFTSYTVTASNSGGSTSVLLAIGVNDKAPSGLTYSQNPVVYPKRFDVTANTPSNSGGVVLSYSVSPPLPAGLVLNTSTGVITGRPTALAAAATYTVTASNSGGTATVDVSIAVTESAPGGLTYSQNPVIYTTMVPITPNLPAGTGGAADSYTVSPALPTGLGLNAITGVISGTPTTGRAALTYTITATNGAGSTTIGVNIRVVARPVIAVGPLNAPVVEGGTAKFSVTAGGTGTLSYQWQKNDVDIDGANSASYTTPPLVRGDCGTRYAVVVSDTYGGRVTSAYAYLTLGTFSLLSSDTDMQTARTEFATTLLPNGKVLITGGATGVSTADLFDPATGNFSPTGNMVKQRWGHTSTLLPNGKVLIAGGFLDKSSVPPALANAELYNPASGTFTATGSLNIARGQHTATLLANGKVLIAGGTSPDPNTFTASAEVYDPATGLFTSVGALIGARTLHEAVALPSGKVLMAGGYNAGALKSAELFDPVAQTFTSAGNMTANRFRLSAVLLRNGKVLIAAGQGSSGYLYSAELYDPVVGTFTATGRLARARGGQTAALLPNGKVLIAGGYNATTYAELYDPTTATFSYTGNLKVGLNDLKANLLPSGKVLITGITYSGEIYDTEDINPGLFTAAGNLAAARGNHTATVLPDGRVLIAGGNNGTPLASAELHDPASGTFSAAASGLGTARDHHTATLLPNGKVLIAGGSNGAVVASAETFDVTTATFAPTTGGMATARRNHTATLLPNGLALIVGGDDGVNSLATAELYDSTTKTFSPTTGSLGVARSLHTANLLPNGLVLIAGGSGPGALASAELYDPTTKTFTPTPGPLSSARSQHTATLLGNGLVLIVGGNDTDALTSAESFDPATGTFTVIAAGLAVPRYAHTATLLGNGLVLIGGGNNNGTALAGAELYDPTAATFTVTATPLLSPRHSHTATRLGSGQILFTGGTNSTYLAQTESYQ